MRSKISRILLIIGFFIVICIYEILSFLYANENYKPFTLENITCRIPKKMWNPEEDNIYISEHMFSIIDKEKDYIIYGSQLEKYNYEDEQYGILNSFDISSLSPPYNELDLQKIINDDPKIIANIYDSGVHKRPDFNLYYYDGFGEYEQESYNIYMVAYTGHEVLFIEIILYTSPYDLSKREKRDIYSYQVFDYEKDYWGIRNINNSRHY